MKRENIRIKPVDGSARTHAQGNQGNDFTLCGLTTDGDSLVVKWQRNTSQPITCEDCWHVIEFCRKLKQRKIAVERGRKA